MWNSLGREWQDVDEELEKKNFKVAGSILAEIWSELVLDGYPVFAEYIEDEKLLTSGYDEGWVYRHCRISQYMLQIVKCSQMRTVRKSVIPSGFLPAPAPINIEKGVNAPVKQNTKKTDKYPNLWKRLAITDLVPYTGFTHMPYDWHCPSITNIDEGKVALYFQTKRMTMNQWKKCCLVAKTRWKCQATKQQQHPSYSAVQCSASFLYLCDICSWLKLVST